MGRSGTNERHVAGVPVVRGRRALLCLPKHSTIYLGRDWWLGIVINLVTVRFILAVPQFPENFRDVPLPARSPLLVLRVARPTVVAEGTLVTAIFSLYYSLHPYLLRSSVGLCLKLVNVDESAEEGGWACPRFGFPVFPSIFGLMA